MRAWLLAGFIAASAASAQTPPRVIANVDFVGSECVRYDAVADRYIVSNLNGPEPGFVSMVTADGTVEKLKWIDGAASGLVDPLGLFIAGDRIYLADVDTSAFMTGGPAPRLRRFRSRARSG